MTIRRLTPAVFVVAFSAIAVAQAPALNVRIGLWEMTSTTTIGGEAPAVDTKGMTPAQKAQVDAAMSAMMGTHTDVSKSCITKEDLARGDFMENDGDSDCKRTLTRNTPTALDMNVVCTGDQASKGQITVEALTPTAIKALMKSTMTSEGRTMTMNMAMTGKWLGADCGSVK